jgi:2,5-furandicarboxylate decarboxylase 1
MMPAVIIDATKPVPPAEFPPRALVPQELVDAVDLDTWIKPYRP